LALIIETEKDFGGLKRCPYTAVEVRDALATHDWLRGTHSCVYVRITSDQYRKYPVEKAERTLEKRFRWLIHEAVDGIITDRTDLLTRLDSPNAQ
jgi:hypothetical protein